MKLYENPRGLISKIINKWRDKRHKMQKEIIQYIKDNKEKHYRIAYSYVKNQEDALDIVQDTIVKALKYERSLKNSEYMGTWFCRILINNCKTYLKKKNKVIYIEEMEDLVIESSNHEQIIDIQQAIDRLNTHEREIILLRFYQGLELKEVAEATGKNLSTVKSILYRGMKKLKVLLEE